MTPPSDPRIYRAARPDDLVVSELDSLAALYDRRSGLTHLVAQPVPAILAALAEGPVDLAALLVRLERDFAVEGAPGALAARLYELVALGLVEAL